VPENTRRISIIPSAEVFTTPSRLLYCRRDQDSIYCRKANGSIISQLLGVQILTSTSRTEIPPAMIAVGLLFEGSGWRVVVGFEVRCEVKSSCSKLSGISVCSIGPKRYGLTPGWLDYKSRAKTVTWMSRGICQKKTKGSYSNFFKTTSS
jgi:hypothetical protein